MTLHTHAQRLVLFDIDGTILHGGRLFRDCYVESFRERFSGVEIPRISFSGKTDRQICREMMQAVGLLQGREDSWRERQIDAVIRGYLDRIRERAPGSSGEITVLPGVDDLIQELLKRSEAIMGLLTGNVSEGAKLKLSAVGMDHYFGFGAFGDDHWDRYELPLVAVSRAKERFGIEFQGKQIVIIGDTVHDVNCGRSLGVRAIAVGTGRGEQRAEILAAKPDRFFEDLSDTEAVMRAIFEDLG